MTGRIIFFYILSIAGASAQDTTKLSLLFLGDIMQHDSQIAAAFDATTGKYDYTECFQHVKPVFESADLTIGNLELSLGGAPYKGYPNFSAPDELVDALIWSGVDVLVTANNHCLDRGRKGLQRTIGVLDTLRVPHTGTFLDSTHRAYTYPLFVEKNGIRISLLNYTYGTNGIPVTKPNIVNYIDTTLIASDIIRAKAQEPDLIITFFHWGEEYQRLPNKTQKNLAEFCFKHGVKLVIGAHPHVIQPMEWRKEDDQLVVYSLGNFVSGQTSRYKNGGAMLFVELNKIKKALTDSTDRTARPALDAGDNVVIANAEYQLQYVYRDRKKKFHILPVQGFEADTITVAEKVAQASIKQFASDSRTLFMDNNVNIGERPYHLVDSVFFIAVEAGVDSLDTYPVVKFYGVKSDSVGGKAVTRVGEFYDKEVAAKALTDLQTQIPHAKATLVRRRKD
ncbi:MAG TPA: CapA family protein [Cyclobacteriaceae bacterium]|nr:CapA family protein [Cyclobacteriaceae bacterium]